MIFILEKVWRRQIAAAHLLSWNSKARGPALWAAFYELAKQAMKYKQERK